MALSIAKKLYMEVINDSNEVNLSLSNVQGFTFSERARMPVVPCSNEFAIRKLMSSGCHGRHPLDSVRDCSDSLFAVETSQAQFMKRMRNQQPRRKRRGCCSHKVVAVGFNTLCYDASVGVLNPPHE